MSRPVPTTLTVALLAAGLLPAALAIAQPLFLWIGVAWDAAVLVLCALDFWRAPPREALRVRRRMEEVLSSGTWNQVRLELEGASNVRGEVRDEVPPGMRVEGHRQRFWGGAPVEYRVWPATRGDAEWGEVHVRLAGPLGLCARQVRYALRQQVRVYPDLTALSREALALATSSDAPSPRTIKKPSEGREFESFREYHPGDDARTIDWKASARRAKTIVRVYQPERNQPVLLLLDCGRHMAGLAGGRRKLDHAVDAALRLARVSLDRGDLVGVVAFAREVKTFLPPRRGADHLRAITSALYRLEAVLEESDYGAALELAFARHHRRTLVVLFTDLQDRETSSAVLTRTLALRPRHLPMVVSLLDEDLARAAQTAPGEVHEAYVRQVATRLEDEFKRTTAVLRDAGALAVRAPASAFGAAAVNEYLRVKARGLL